MSMPNLGALIRARWAYTVHDADGINFLTSRVALTRAADDVRVLEAAVADDVRIALAQRDLLRLPAGARG